MSSSTHRSFPNIHTKESKKDENYHREFLLAITNRLNGSYSAAQSVMDQCYKYFSEGSDPEAFRYLQEASDGSNLPAMWQSINKIKNKVKILGGELWQRGYDFRVNAINKDARVRRLEAKEDMRVSLRIQPFTSQLEQYSGLPTQQQALPESEEELDEFFDKNYKEESETVIYHALKFLDKTNSWSVKRYELFLDLLIAGKCIVKNEIVQGLPKIKRIDPRFFIHDQYADGNFIEDSTYFGRIEYMSIGDAVEKYNLSKEELQDCYEKYTDFTRILSAKSGNPVRQQEVDGFSSLSKESGLKWFKETSDGLRVLVLDASWIDYKKYKHKVSEDNYGDEHIKQISPDAQDREGVISKNIKTWRQATLIGGKFLKEWGELPNQPHDIDSLHETKPPYVVLIPDFVNGRAVSIVEQMLGLQNLKDIITYDISLAMARAGSKGFVYDVSQCPDTWDVATVIKYLKTVGIAFINRKQNGTPSQFNQFQQFDLSLSESVSKYLELSAWVDSEMDAVSGVNEARQGVVQGASQAVGVTRSALVQSSLTTATLFNLFDEFSTRVWNYQAKLVKIAFPENPERFAPIIGDVAIDFLTNDIDLDLNDYGVFVTVTPALLDDLNNFQQIIMAALQAGSIDFRDAMVLLQERDVMSGIQKYMKISQKREEAAAEQERQMMIEQEKIRQEGQVRLAQFNQQQAETAAQRASALQQAKNQGDLTKEMVNGRQAMQLEKVRAIRAIVNGGNDE